MMPPFEPELLLRALQQLPDTSRYWVAYSGGLDSSVLLHALAQLGGRLSVPLSVVHVNHGLSPHSGEWTVQCRQQCEVLGLSLCELKVAVERHGRGIEAAARQARYAALARVVGEGEMLLTAHHQDDQAETLLLQLLRGGGVRGLAAMPASRRFAAGWLGRPLLGYSRASLQGYAESQGLRWVEDPSNFDTSLSRNYLRHALLPQLEERYGGIKAILARSAGHFAESATLLDELADQDLLTVAGGEGASLSIPSLQLLSAGRQRNLLRYWLRRRGLTVPDSRNLQRILDEVLSAAADGVPQVRWPGAEVRRYRDQLHALPPLPPLPGQMAPLPWEGEGQMSLPAGQGVLHIKRCNERGMAEAWLGTQRVTIGWRRGGEALSLPGRAGHHQLKKLFQEAGVPPWERERRPLIYIDGALAQVAGLWTDERFACGAGEQGICFEWTPAIEMASENNDN